jgi:hypothetical protein
VENGKLNGAREFADLLCSKHLHVKGYRIRFTQKRNNKKIVVVEANYHIIGTIDIRKGYVFGSNCIMYGSPDRENEGSKQVISVLFHDVCGMRNEIARVENGMLNTSDIELAQRIVNIYSDFVERMIVPVTSENSKFDKICDIVLSLKKFNGRIVVDGKTRLDANANGKQIIVKIIKYGGVCDNYMEDYSFSELDDRSLESIKEYIERQR